MKAVGEGWSKPAVLGSSRARPPARVQRALASPQLQRPAVSARRRSRSPGVPPALSAVVTRLPPQRTASSTTWPLFFPS